MGGKEINGNKSPKVGNCQNSKFSDGRISKPETFGYSRIKILVLLYWNETLSDEVSCCRDDAWTDDKLCYDQEWDG